MQRLMIVGLTDSDVLPGQRVVRTFAQNVDPSMLQEALADAKAQGWTALSWHVEAF